MNIQRKKTWVWGNLQLYVQVYAQPFRLAVVIPPFFLPSRLHYQVCEKKKYHDPSGYLPSKSAWRKPASFLKTTCSM